MAASMQHRKKTLKTARSALVQGPGVSSRQTRRLNRLRQTQRCTAAHIASHIFRYLCVQLYSTKQPTNHVRVFAAVAWAVVVS